MSIFQDSEIVFGQAGLPGTGLTAGEKTNITNRLTMLEGEIAAIPDSIGDLTDVDLTSIATNDLLRWNGTKLVKYTPAPIVVPFSIPAIANGGGSVPATGTQGAVFLPFACTIVDWRIYNNISGSIEWDLYIGGVSITGSNKPKTVSAGIASMSTLSGWTTSLPEDTVLEFLINSASTVTISSLNLVLQRTLTWGS